MNCGNCSPCWMLTQFRPIINNCTFWRRHWFITLSHRYVSCSQLLRLWLDACRVVSFSSESDWPDKTSSLWPGVWGAELEFFLLFFWAWRFFFCSLLVSSGCSRMVGFCRRSLWVGGSATMMARAPCILGGDLQWSSPWVSFQQRSWERCSFSISRSDRGRSNIWRERLEKR